MKRLLIVMHLALQMTLCGQAKETGKVTINRAKDNGGEQMEITCGTMCIGIETSSQGGWISRLEGASGLKGRTPLPIFEVVLRKVSGERDTVRSNSGWNQVSIRKTGRRDYVMTFSGASLRDGGQMQLQVVLSMQKGGKGSSREDSGLCLAWAGSHVPEGWKMETSSLLPLRFGAVLAGTKFLCPYSSGILYEPATENFERNIPYPSGFGASMGWYALYGPQGGFYYAAHDPDATHKMLYTKGTVGESLEMRFDYPASDNVQQTTDNKSDAHIVLAPLNGDWFTAALRYRTWVRSEASWFPRNKMGPEGRMDTPLWMKELCLWVQGAANPQDLAEIRAAFGVPVGFHWYNWHAIPFDNDYPHYFPPKKGFQEDVRKIQSMGLYVMPYINGRLWDMRDHGLKDSLFTQQALPAVTKDWDGNPRQEQYGSKESDGSPVSLGVMCPKTETWRTKMEETVLRLCLPESQGGYGTKAVYMDQIAAAPPVTCHDTSHGHPLGGGSWWTRAYRDMLHSIRMQKPADTALTTESNADGYINEMDGFLVWQFQHDGQVPAFAAVYGGSIQLFGRTYATMNPVDCKMSLAQSFVWGEQLGWLPSTTAILQSEFFPFMKQVVALRHQFRRYFYAGEMARAPRLIGDNPEMEAKWSFTGRMYLVRNPSVLCGTWTIPSEGRTLLLFANYNAIDIRLGVEYPLAEWGYGKGRYIAKRYNADGTEQQMDNLPEDILFHANEAFVLEITKQ